METKTIENLFKTFAIVFTIDTLLLFSLRDTEVGNMVTFILTIGMLFSFNEKAKNTENIYYKNTFFKRQNDGYFYSTETPNLRQLNPEIVNQIIEEKNKIKKIPANIIEGGAEVFDTIKFNGAVLR